MTDLLIRSFDIETTGDGRTVEGLAFLWERSSPVSDRGGPLYLEAFARTSADKTIAERSARPLFRSHRHNEDPIGSTTFERSSEGLVFRARLSKTRPADETLELVNDGAMNSASIGFVGYRSRKEARVEGLVTVRAEIGIRELSLTATGFGQHAGAGVLAVRSDIEEGTPLLDSVAGLVLLAPLVV